MQLCKPFFTVIHMLWWAHLAIYLLKKIPTSLKQGSAGFVAYEAVSAFGDFGDLDYLLVMGTKPSRFSGLARLAQACSKVQES